MDSLAKSLCESCDIRQASPDRQSQLRLLAEAILQQWWVGNLSLTLQDVSNDFRFTDRPDITESEWELLNGCMAEHSSNRCWEMTDAGIMNNEE